MSPAPSIRTSPPSGKDPPRPQPATEPSSAVSSPPLPPARISSLQTKDDRHRDNDEDTDVRTMPPPPAPSHSRPSIPQTTSSSSIPHANTSASSSHNLPPSSSDHQSRLPPLQRQNMNLSQLETSSRGQIPPQTPGPPGFAPFFVLVDDPANKSTYHPHRVHYLFSDDEDTEVLTSALVRSLEGPGGRNDEANGNGPGERRGEEEDASSSEETSSSGVRHSHKRKKGREKDKMREARRGRQKEREERVLIVDINEKGDAITSVNSLCQRWQVLNASIESAPTFDAQDDHGGAGDTNRGLMLRIEGLGVESLSYEDEKGKGGGIGSGMPLGDEEMRELLEGFDKKMEVLRKLVGENAIEGLGVGTGHVDGEGEGRGANG
ncbi:uncharacterized protein BP5553_09980 [Venustampulla echinocandica]|uniref:Uncharacterized protein n=1 Tax=Venustampulla echinocandica TaxID=2656787 RepID=A0A370TB85_9HELO|nr:uncharacterized protein BP5553_09980 [Venustampulla echinocandica]RDL31191.1 hypothetical protein BP5553_09980 [Venustampulla echinocandica]